MGEGRGAVGTRGGVVVGGGGGKGRGPDGSGEWRKEKRAQQERKFSSGRR